MILLFNAVIMKQTKQTLPEAKQHHVLLCGLMAFMDVCYGLNTKEVAPLFGLVSFHNAPADTIIRNIKTVAQMGAVLLKRNRKKARER